VRYSWTILLGVLVVCEIQCRAQETVFNVPSADVLSRRVVYGEFDMAVRPSDLSFAFTPRVVVGVGHNIEAGLNFLGPAQPATGEYILSPAIKWKFHDGGDNGWSVFAGDNLFVPIHNRAYDVGTYTYVEVAKRFGSVTRVGAGGYYFSPHVVADANRAGGQFSVEQKISSTLTLAADWFTGDHANGYLASGVIWNATGKLAIYGAYQVGNAGVLNGNHGPLFEVGYTF
jgi:hypothetical protein